MTTPSTERRTAFTLIELLVVIGIIVILATLALMFLPNLDRNKGVPNAVAQLHGWVNLSRQQALRDGAARGVRLIEDSPGSGHVTALQYIEQPEPYAPRGPGIKVDIRAMMCYDPVLFPTAPNTGPLTVVTLYQDPTGMVPAGTYPPESFWLDWEGVQPGDYFQVTGGPNEFAAIRRFTFPAQPSPPGLPPAPTGARKYAQLVLDRLIEGTGTGSPIQSSSNFRVIRQPRPLVGEPMLQLNKDIYIDLARSHPCPPHVAQAFPARFQATAAWSTNIDPLTGRPQLDILFNSNGTVASAPYGQIFLWVQHAEQPNDALLLSIFTRTGKIGPYSIFDADPNTYDPYGIARAGQTPGL